MSRSVGSSGGGGGRSMWRGSGGGERKQRDDFDAEARKLFKALNLAADGSGKPRSQYNSLDPIYKHPTSGGVVYVGNIGAAQTLTELRAHGITRVVNCQDKTSKNFFESRNDFEYFRFPIAHWLFGMKRTKKGVLSFFAPVWEWIDKNVAAGHSVLIHCLAGAHRAGSTGISYIMHKTNVDFPTATKIAQKCRPIINPIASLGELLMLLDEAMRSSGSRSAAGGGGTTKFSTKKHK